jgi:hypothetical protein
MKLSSLVVERSMLIAPLVSKHARAAPRSSFARNAGEIPGRSLKLSCKLPFDVTCSTVNHPQYPFFGPYPVLQICVVSANVEDHIPICFNISTTSRIKLLKSARSPSRKLQIKTSISNSRCCEQYVTRYWYQPHTEARLNG